MTNNKKFTFNEVALIEAYNNFRRCVVDFCRESGMCYEMSQTIISTAEMAEHREEIVRELQAIDAKYND